MSPVGPPPAITTACSKVSLIHTLLASEKHTLIVTSNVTHTIEAGEYEA
jgi:hypothetical protein